MHILIIGAGRIGRSVAENLVNESNDITIVDQDAERVSALETRLDLRGVTGNALSPSVLESAGANDADMILAVTANDETNMAVCLLASQLFNIPTRIARVRNQELRQYPRLLAEEGFQITSTIWPEQALNESLLRLIEFPEALQIIDFAEGKAVLFCVRAVAGSPLVGRPIGDLAVHLPHVPARIVSVFRRNRRLDISSETVIESSDEVIALSSGRDVRRVISELRQHEERIRRIMIAGNARLGVQLAGLLNGPESGSFLPPNTDGRRGYTITILDEDAALCTSLAAAVPKDTELVTANLTDEEALTELCVDRCDLFISLSSRDENNIMGALLAKKLGARRVIALTDSDTFSALMQGTQIDVTVSSTQATIGELLRHVRRGDVLAAHSLRRGVAEALEIVAHGNKRSSKVVGKRIADIDLPEGVEIAALVRDTDDIEEPEVLIAQKDVVVEPEDRVIVFVPGKRVIPQVEKLFAVDVGFF